MINDSHAGLRGSSVLASPMQVSSRDGYCSLTTFVAGELGAPAPAEAVPAHIARRLAVATKSIKPRWAPAHDNELPRSCSTGFHDGCTLLCLAVVLTITWCMGDFEPQVQPSLFCAL